MAHCVSRDLKMSQGIALKFKALFGHDYSAALYKLRDLMIHHNVTELSIPKLGCGLDCISPHLFYSLLSSVFCDDPITVTVYDL